MPDYLDLLSGSRTFADCVYNYLEGDEDRESLESALDSFEVLLSDAEDVGDIDYLSIRSWAELDDEDDPLS